MNKGHPKSQLCHIIITFNLIAESLKHFNHAYFFRFNPIMSEVQTMLNKAWRKIIWSVLTVNGVYLSNVGSSGAHRVTPHMHRLEEKTPTFMLS